MATTTGYIDFTEQTAPSSPSASHDRLFVDSADHLLKWKNSSGTVTTIATGSSGMSDPMTTRGDIIVRNAANATARLAVGATANMALRSDGTDVGYAILPGTLLAINQYGSGTYTTSSATLADVDATNMLVTFTAPASGNVIVRLSALADTSVGTAGQFFVWGCRESTTNLGGETAILRAPDASGGYRTAVLYFTGVSAGSHTYKWSFAISQASAATGRILTGAGGAGNSPKATMEVWAA